jgi:hypothetical protein
MLGELAFFAHQRSVRLHQLVELLQRGRLWRCTIDLDLEERAALMLARVGGSFANHESVQETTRVLDDGRRVQRWCRA